MSTLQEIEQSVQQLSSKSLAEFRAWFAEFDAKAWDRQFEADAKNGRLSELAAEATRELREGRTKDR